MQHCCRNVLCSKFPEPRDCAWISSGDDTWKRDLSNDLDRVEYIEKRLKELSKSDFGDPDAATEKTTLTVSILSHPSSLCLLPTPGGSVSKNSFREGWKGPRDRQPILNVFPPFWQREQAQIEKREMAQLKKVSPLTTMCDSALDSAVSETGFGPLPFLPSPSLLSKLTASVADAESIQEARVDCVTLFVQIASGSCAWEPKKNECINVAAPGKSGSSVWPTITVVVVSGRPLACEFVSAGWLPMPVAWW